MKIHQILIALTLLAFSILITEKIALSEYYKNTVTIGGEFNIILLDENRNSNSEPMDYGSTDIQLVSPGNGLKLDTLTPLYVWDVLEGLGNVQVGLTFGTTPDPTDFMMYTTRESGHWEYRQAHNLESNTTYYWRVGIKFSDDTIQWSDQWSFITADSGGEIPPPPILISPINNITVSSNNLTLKWNAVGEALKYSVSLHNVDEDLWYGWPEVIDTEITNTSWCIEPGFNYEWHVAARNSYAWGTRSEYGRFNTSFDSSDLYVNKDGSCWGKTPCYTKIQGAIDDANTGSTIKIAEGTYDETFVLSQSKILTLQGGWDSSYETQTSNSTFIKAPKVSQGSLTLQILTVKP